MQEFWLSLSKQIQSQILSSSMLSVSFFPIQYFKSYSTWWSIDLIACMHVYMYVLGQVQQVDVYPCDIILCEEAESSHPYTHSHTRQTARPLDNASDPHKDDLAAAQTIGAATPTLSVEKEQQHQLELESQSERWLPS